MKKNKCLVYLSLTFCLLIFTAQAVFAGGPSGHSDTLEGGLRYLLQDHLQSEGYMGQFDHGQDLQRGMSAFLWDNRDWFKTVDFHNSRKVDALACLLAKKGYPGLDGYFSSEVVRNWCDQTVAKP